MRWCGVTERAPGGRSRLTAPSCGGVALAGKEIVVSDSAKVEPRRVAKRFLLGSPEEDIEVGKQFVRHVAEMRAANATGDEWLIDDALQRTMGYIAEQCPIHEMLTLPHPHPDEIETQVCFDDDNNPIPVYADPEPSSLRHRVTSWLPSISVRQALGRFSSTTATS